MSTAITTIHVIVAIILMVSVLLQSGKGSGLGAAFGGSSSSVFGSRGPASLIGKVTSVAAIIFMVTSLTLSIFAQGGGPSRSVITEDTVQAEGQDASQGATGQPAGSAAGGEAAPMSDNVATRDSVADDDYVPAATDGGAEG